MGTPRAEEILEKPSSVFRNRNFRLYWTGETISIFGSSIGEFAFGIVAVVELGASAGQMGLILALGRAPRIVLGLFAGEFVDRVRRRRLLIGVDIAAMCVVGSVRVLYALDALTIQWLYVNAVLFGTIGALWWPAWNAFLPSLVSKDHLVDANSKIMLSWSMSGFVGPTLAGILVELIRAPATMMIDAASFALSAFYMFRVRVTEIVTGSGTEGEAVVHRIKAGLRIAFLDRMQRAVTAPRAILDLVDATVLAVYVIYVLRAVDLTPFLLGIVFACGAFGFTVGSLVASRIERRFGAGPSALLGLALVGISPFTMILANDANPAWLNVIYLGIPGVVGGFGGLIQYVMLSSIRQAITPSDALGRVVASVGVLGGLMGIVGALLGGWLGDTIGLRPTIAVVACGYTVPFFYSLLSPLKGASTKGAVDPSLTASA